MAALDETVRFGHELIIYGVVRGGVTLVRQGAHASRTIGHNRDEAVILRVCPAAGSDAVEDDVLTAGTPFYLRTREGDYFQRTDDRRFRLGFTDHASQTAQISGVDGEVRYGQELGISFAGSVEDSDTNKRRFLSLLPDSEPSCAAETWGTDENLVLIQLRSGEKKNRTCYSVFN
eukprot:TRINITY_DN3772_c0_g1_i2.p1 TRINITY_DN3772_c0_g1~~TRINITY_DN3772_c0_g1_i2.p1  ORF type:complete len:175 (-),score=26.06 TRINITY_DN3772_c0_g1_i2:41-565(-)